ncbi:MAG: formate/nitrite transporter family protein [Actinomycetia bacterium]|nr:formate/nitrite transporter family protein [Actinomycetes bacterium]
MTDQSLDALLPAAMAAKAEQVGVAKANLPLHRLIPLGMLAGAFIALGANFATVVTAGGGSAPGVTRLLGGVVFSLGLILVVVSGAELFTGNTLIVVAFAGRKVTAAKLLRNWLVVYLSNFVGALATAALVVWSGQLKAGDGAVGARAQAIAETKGSLHFGQAISSAVLANCLVCLAVWMTLSARTLVDKIVVIVPPIAAFVAAGFEHSVANMYFFPVALFSSPTTGHVTWQHFLVDNLLPVTIGNIIGGAVLVGLVYWFVYLRGEHEPR